MRLTKLEHSCVRLEKDGAVLVIDPGSWSVPSDTDGANAVFITHEHPDHLDPDRMRALLRARPATQLWTNASVAGQFEDFGGQVRVVTDGDAFTAAVFDVRVYGSEHALLHPDLPPVPNVGFAVDGTVFHPGDALTIPGEPVTTLLLPGNAPWLKVSEMVDYAREVAPQRAYAIHEGLLNARGLALLDDWLERAAEPLGATFTRLEPGTTVDI